MVLRDASASKKGHRCVSNDEVVISKQWNIHSSSRNILWKVFEFFYANGMFLILKLFPMVNWSKVDSFSVRSSHQIATRRCQNSENGTRPAQTGDTHQMERTGKVSTADLTWYLAPKQNKKVEVQDNAGKSNMGWYIFSVECAFFAFLEMCSLW